ncbi:hypothetical protein [Streptomyces sp. NBC_01465]|uniref:hypothetical protein n=1 Tax=Streptomyces sp. NBC_01465 TaxID=2903878 RepID=UPI002E37D704|nr:hypothetical protein [Streptomyces sp. NBC_01465]
MGRSIRLPFGPYTLTQLGAMVATAVLLVLTRPVWGGHGYADAAAVLLLPFAAAFALRYLHVDGRNPLAAVLSVGLMLASPRRGRLDGRSWRPAPARRTDCLITLGTPAEPVRQPAPAPPAVADPPTRPALRTPHAPTAPSPVPPAPAPGVPGRPVVSGVQALLARRTAAPTSTSLED